MKSILGGHPEALCLAAMFGCAALSARTNAADTPEARDFSGAGQAVVRLLTSRDAAAFAKEIAPSLEDWRVAASTMTSIVGEEPLGPGFQRGLDQQRQQVEQSARRLLEKADELKLDFSRARLQIRAIAPGNQGRYRNPTLQAESESLPWAAKVDIIVTAEPGEGAAEAGRVRGDFGLALGGMLRFSGGWRSYEGVRWTTFPPGVADEKTRREVAILSSAAENQGLTQAEDPALAAVGEVLTRFIRERDLKILEAGALLNFEAFRALIERQAPASQRPARQELEKGWLAQREELLAPARAVLDQIQQAGIDLGDAEIRVKAASFKSLVARSGPGSLEGLQGNQLQVVFQVQSGGKSKTGKSLSGDYVLTANEAMRVGGRWLISRDLRWQNLPAGVLDGKAEAALALENYVAEYHSLPPGTAAPEIEFIRVDNEQKGKLTDLRGKVVVLDFWATWCGPCQEPMARLQKLRDGHPEWSNRVEAVSLSIDDDLSRVRVHLQQRGWTNTFNTWAGPGAWQAHPARAFRVTSIPTCYILDPQGNVALAGPPAMLRIEDAVAWLVARSGPAVKPR